MCAAAVAAACLVGCQDEKCLTEYEELYKMIILSHAFCKHILR